MALVFPILTQFDDRAAKKADKTFGALGKKFAAVFSVAAVTKFAKSSVRAFMEAEKEAAQLRATLEAVNLGFASPLITQYIDNLELLSGKSGGDLTRAFTTLSQATGDVTTAQDLLSLSLDVAAGTGKDLATVANALQRAYKGETTALARLRIGYTTAELKGKKFADVVEELQKKFEGAGAAAADTFAGKIARLKSAVEQAQEAFGEGFVRELENANVSIEDLQKGIINLGEALGTTAAAFIKFATDAVDAMKAIRDNPATQAVLDVFEVLTQGVGFIVTGELQPSWEAGDARRAGEERRRTEVANRAALRSRNALIKAEKKITNERKQQIEQTAKDKANSEKLAKAKTMFDMEQIQIQAALQGKITAEEKLRLELMKAILNENAARAAQLAADLKKAQDDTKLLAESMSKFVASDPFAFWSTYFAAQNKERTDLDANLKEFDANDPFSFWGTYWAMQKKERDDLDGAIKDIKGDNPFTGYPDLFKDQIEATAELDEDLKSLQAGDPFPGWDGYISARIAGVQALKSELAALSAAQAAAAAKNAEIAAEEKTTTEILVETKEDATKIIADTAQEAASDITPNSDLSALTELFPDGLNLDLGGFDFLSQLSSLGGMGLSGMNVTVNVEGSVISQTDLIAGIMQGLYEIQNNGQIVVTKKTQIP